MDVLESIGSLMYVLIKYEVNTVKNSVFIICEL